MKKTDNPTPSLQDGLKIAEFYERPLNHSVVLVSPVAPMVNSSGMVIGNAAQKDHQQQLNQRGVLVVKSPFSKEDENPNTALAVYPGEKVIFQEGVTPLFSAVVTTKQFVDGLDIPTDEALIKPEMYKKFVVLGLPVHSLTCVVNESKSK